MAQERWRVHEAFSAEANRIGKDFARDVKKKYNLQQLDISHQFLTQLIAGKLSGKQIKFRIRKTGLNTGYAEMI